MAGKQCRAKWAGPILVVLGLGMLIFCAGFLGNFIDNKVKDAVTKARRIDAEDVAKYDFLNAPPYNDWAKNEKAFEFETYTIYNLTNPDEVLLNGVKPNFQEVKAYKFKIVKRRFGEDGPGEPIKFHTRTDFVDPYNQYGYTPSSTQETVVFHEYKTKEEADPDTSRRLDTDEIWTLNPAWVIGPHSMTLGDPNGFFSMAHVSASVLVPLHIVLVTATWPKLPAASQGPFNAYLMEVANTTGFDLGSPTSGINANATKEVFKIFGGDLLSELSPAGTALSKKCTLAAITTDQYLNTLAIDGPIAGNLDMQEYNAATLLDPTSQAIENVDLCGFRELGSVATFIGFLSTANETAPNAANHTLSWNGTSSSLDWTSYLLGVTNNDSATITAVINGQVKLGIAAQLGVPFDALNAQHAHLFSISSISQARVQANIDQVYHDDFVQRLKTFGFLSPNVKAGGLLTPNSRLTAFGAFGADYVKLAGSHSAKRLETAYLQFVAPALAGDTASLFNSATGQFTGDLSLKHGIFVKKKAREVIFGCMDKRSPDNIYRASLDFRVRGAPGSELDGRSDYCTIASMWEPVFAGLQPAAGLALMTLGAKMPKNDAEYWATNPKPLEYVTGKQDIEYANTYYSHSNLTNTGPYWTKIETITSTQNGLGMAPLRENTRFKHTWAYLSDARRTVRFNYTKNTEFRGIKNLRRYELDPSHLSPDALMVNPGLLNKEDGTPYTGAALKQKEQYPSMAGDPSGILSLQRFLALAVGAAVPIALTLPHFMSSGFVAEDHFTGLSPNAALHSTYLDHEPITGGAVDAHKRIQFAIRLDQCFMDTGKYEALFSSSGVTGYPTGGQAKCKTAINTATGTLIPAADVTTTTVNPTAGVLPMTPNVRMPWAITAGDYLHWPLGWLDQGGGATQKIADEVFTDGIYKARDRKKLFTILGSVFGGVFIIAGLVCIYLGWKVWAGTSKKVAPMTNLEEEQQAQTTPKGGHNA